MSIGLLQTKLYIPPPRSKGVARPRLIERLNEGLGESQGGRKLTLISAPAGFGKTTLVSEWVTACQRPTAWLSLDEGDSDPTRFLAYLVAALQTISQNLGAGALAMLQSPQPPPLESILTTLLNELTTLSDKFLLILDDYHLIDVPPVDASMSVDDALSFLVEHLPPQLHLVIATREDPPLPLARLRVRDQLTELRADDLRFTPAEAATFLNQVMGLDLSAEEIAALETRTEGWVAGLQMAALSMQRREDITGFIQAFTGSHRFVLDYLVEEVLQGQPERVRNFLRQTAILNRLSGLLCDAVRFDNTETDTEQEDSKGLLETLERGNLFVVPLDDQRQWYRYHHLFAEVLYVHAMEEQPDQVPMLHRRASEWYERNDLPSDAIRHALAAEDFERAAGLAELAWPAWSGSFQSIAWLGWVKELPEELVRARPVLSVAYAWAFLNAGMLEAAEARLLDAERWLEPTTDLSNRPETPPSKTGLERSRRMVVVDKEQFRSLPVSLATARAYHAQAIGNVSGTVKYARRVLDLLPDGDHKWRGDATALLGLAYWASGELEAAHHTFADGLAGMKPLDVIVGTFVLADIKATLGHLHEAVSICEDALQLATEHDEPIGTEDVYTGISELHREQGDLETAAHDLVTSRMLGEKVELPDWQYRWCIAQARLKETLGDLDGALKLLDEAERLYVRTPLPDLRPIAAMKVRVWIKQGRLIKALSWARERNLSAADALSYRHEFEYVTLARVLIARYKHDRAERAIQEAVGLLARLLKGADKGERTGSVIEILVLQALAYETQGDITSALVPLERALTLAEPEGYIRIFVDEGTPMTALLQEAAARGIMPGYTGNLLAAFEAGAQRGEDKSPPPTTTAPQPLIEPLTQRELDVLRLLRTELSGPEIARELVIALSTVRTHTKRIYSKLNVNNRRAAIKRATALGLI